MTEESVTVSTSNSPCKPKYKLFDNELKRFVRTSEESSPVAVPEKISSNSSTIEESNLGRKITNDSRLKGLASSPSPGISLGYEF